ncbi:MAG: MotA/TolQ/ExbB proton channel family protein [Campylobacterales bacterium]|nr:MotA/TolQ/ExbB proton channel family protein [Campylobacterales bacterium]
MNIDSLLDYLQNSGLITYIILGLLSIYFITVFWIFFYRLFYLNNWISKEKDSLESLFMGNELPSTFSFLRGCIKNKEALNKDILNACFDAAIKDATFGLTFLSIIATTSPFIGLFGTVVSILESFSALGAATKASLNVLAPAISEALVATAAGILVSIPAYTFHLIIKRKSYELSVYLKNQIQILLSIHNKD